MTDGRNITRRLAAVAFADVAGLGLGAQHIGPEGIEALAEVPFRRLQGLDLCGNDLDDQALQTLSPPQRQTFVLHVDADLSYREVAEVLGISIGTVMSRLYYARQKLRADLAPRVRS